MCYPIHASTLKPKEALIKCGADTLVRAKASISRDCSRKMVLNQSLPKQPLLQVRFVSGHAFIACPEPVEGRAVRTAKSTRLQALVLSFGLLPRATKRLAHLALTVLLCSCVVRAEQGILTVHVEDMNSRPVEDLEIGPKGNGSGVLTLKGGNARIKLAPETKAGSLVFLQILSSPKGHDYVTIPSDGSLTVPSFENESGNFAVVVVMERGDRDALRNPRALRAITAQTVKATRPKGKELEITDEELKAALAEVAKSYGLASQDLDKAIRAWGEKTSDPYEKGLAAFFAKNYPEATKELSDSIAMREEQMAKAQNELGDARFIRGMSLRQEGKYREAAEDYQKALSSYRACDNRKGEAQTLLGLAQLSSTENQPEAFEKSVTYFTQALPLFQATSDRFNEAISWWGLGTANDRLGRTKQARDAYLNALPFFTDKKNDRVIARLLLDLGEDEEALGNLKKAVECYQQALPLLASQHEGLSQGLLLMHLGRAQQKLGETAEAIDTYKDAITVWHSMGEKVSEATSYLMLGMALSALYDWQSAMEADAEALKLGESIGDRSTQAAATIAMAGIYSTLSDYQKSLDLSLRSIALLEGDEVPVRKASALMLAGNCYHALHNYQTALEYMKQSLSLQDSPTAKARVLSAMSSVYSDMGDQKTARELERQAQEILPPEDAPPAVKKETEVRK